MSKEIVCRVCHLLTATDPCRDCTEVKVEKKPSKPVRDEALAAYQYVQGLYDAAIRIRNFFECQYKDKDLLAKAGDVEKALMAISVAARDGYANRKAGK